MDNIHIDKIEVEKIITEAIPVILKEKLTSKYDSPLSRAIEEEIKSSDGAIKTLVREVLSDILANAEMRKKLASELIAHIIQKGLRN